MAKRERLTGQEHHQLFKKKGSDSSADDNISVTEIENKEYDPHNVSTFQSSMMLARFCVGSGLFSIPAAFQYSGIALGVSWVFVNGFLTAYGMKKLVDASWEVSRRTGASAVYYGDLGEESVKVFSERGANYGRRLIDAVIVLTAFAMVCTQIIYMANLWKQGCEQLGVPDMDISVWILVVYCILFPCFQIRRPDILAHFSLIANLFTAVGTVSMFVHIFSVRTYSGAKAVTRVAEYSTNQIHWTKLPLTIGITSYAYQLVAPLVVTLQNVMKNPRRTPFVINIVMAGVSVLYGFMGATGYASCHPYCEDSIILNLPSSCLDRLAAFSAAIALLTNVDQVLLASTLIRYYSVVKVCLGLASCVGTVVGVFILFTILESTLKANFPENRLLCASIISRIFTVTLAGGITSAVPQLGNIMSLAGTLTNPTVGLIFPAVAHMALFHKKLSRVCLAQDIALLIFGLLILFVGIFSSIHQIVHDFKFFKHATRT